MVKKFDKLMRWVVGGQSFINAYHAVKRNQGAAGVDGEQTQDLPRYLMRHWEKIKSQSYSVEPIVLCQSVE